MKVEILIASCCTPAEVQTNIVSTLEGMKSELPDLEWNLLDIDEHPEIAVRYKAPMTPAIYVDGKLEIMGYPKRAALEAKIRTHSAKPNLLGTGRTG